MRHQNCPKSNSCLKDCPPFLKSCTSFREFAVTEAVRKTNFKITDELLSSLQSRFNEAPLKFVQTVSQQEALIQLVLTISNSPSSVRVFHYHNAVEQGLQEELPSEPVIFINSTNKYFDSSKQYQVIASLISKCRDAGKIVIHLHKQDYVI
jgi:hypothetical protein